MSSQWHGGVGLIRGRTLSTREDHKYSSISGQGPSCCRNGTETYQTDIASLSTVQTTKNPHQLDAGFTVLAPADTFEGLLPRSLVVHPCLHSPKQGFNFQDTLHDSAKSTSRLGTVHSAEAANALCD